MGKKRTRADASETRQEWIAAVGALMSQLEQWAAQANWDVATEDKEITESLLGTYTVPALKFRIPGGGIFYAEPIARDIIGADGRVDLYAWPTLHRLLLIRENDGWSVTTDSRLDWPEPWGRQTFLKLAESLTKAP